MNEEEKRQFQEMARTIEDLKRRLPQQSSPSGGDVVLANGINFTGRAADTVPTGAILVRTNQGLVKILIAT